MANFNPQQAHQELIDKLNEVISLLETLTVVSAVAAGMPSTKIRNILRMDQTKVSNISKNITGRASPSISKEKAKTEDKK